MVKNAGGELETDAQTRFKALWRAALDGSTGPPRARAGVTDDGRYGYRYDDEGRFYATLLPGAPPGPRDHQLVPFRR